MKMSLASFLSLAALVACAPAQSSSGNGSGSTTAQGDTLVGVVSEVGADPATWMSLRPSSGGPSLRLSGDGMASIRAVNGTEVWVSGARQADGFRVDRFEVRKANGAPVDDGIVVVEQGKAHLRTRNGLRREIPDAPAQLLTMNGARIWITRPVANQAPSYGVIQRP